jgi:hypothetical protein
LQQSSKSTGRATAIQIEPCKSLTTVEGQVDMTQHHCYVMAVKLIPAYWLVTALLVLGIGLPGGALTLSTASATTGHEADPFDREENSENETATRNNRQKSRDHRARRPLSVIGRKTDPQRIAHPKHSTIASLFIHCPQQKLYTVLRI